MHIVWRGAKRRYWLALLAAAPATTGCEEDLGECNMEAATEVVYGLNGRQATKGQALTHDSCGNGAFCHMSNAYGEDRKGAPAGMNFDMLPVPLGVDAILKRRHVSWQQVHDGHMPPRGATGNDVQGDGQWRFELRPGGEDDSDMLPGLDTDEGKAAFRNWLACGAPVVEKTQLPPFARPPVDLDAGAAPDWTLVYETVLEPNCATAGCHGNGSEQGGLNLEGLCDALDSLKDTGNCGQPRAVPDDGSSLLLESMETEDSCAGDPMPPTGLLDAKITSVVRVWVESGMPAEDCE